MSTDQPTPTGVTPAPFTDPRQWPKAVKVAAAVLLVVAVAFGAVLGSGALGRRKGDAEGKTIASDMIASAVPWQNYRPGLRAELDADGCEDLGLARGLIVIGGGSDDQLVAYIDEQMRQKHC